MTYRVAGGADGSLSTIQATSATIYLNADGSAANASAVKAGAFIVAEGTLSNQGKALTAERITIGTPQGPLVLTGGR